MGVQGVLPGNRPVCLASFFVNKSDHLCNTELYRYVSLECRMSHLIEWVTNNNGSKNVLTVDSYFMLNEHVSHHTPAPLSVNNLLRHWIDTRDSQVRWNSEYFSVETSAIVAKSIKILLKPENLMTWHHPTELGLCCVWPVARRTM